MKSKLRTTTTLTLLLSAVSALALADPDRGWHGGGPWPPGGGPAWHGGGAPPGPRPAWHGPDGNRWRAGYWNHGWHDGRLGWWWVVGGLWTFYAAPVYPYPMPPVVVVQEPSAPVVVQPNIPSSAPPTEGVQSWYYCRASKGYYPYVSSCPGGWEPVSPTPPGGVLR